jgi:hypothetical protein
MTLGRGSFGALNLALLLAAALGGGLFVLAERRAASPLVRLALFRDPVLGAGLAMSAAGHDRDDGDAGGRPVPPLVRSGSTRRGRAGDVGRARSSRR